MLELAAIDVDLRRFSGSVLVVFVVAGSDEACGVEESSGGDGERTKSFRFELYDQVSKTRLELQIGVSMAVLSCLCLATILVTVRYTKTGKNQQFQRRVDKVLESREMAAAASSQNLYANVQDVQSSPAENTVEEGGEGGRSFPRYVNELCSETRRRGESDSKRGPVFKRSGLYIWLVVTVGIFYGIPAAQLVLDYQFDLIFTGNQDLCYYNFLCTVPLGYFKAFNNIYSNVYYLVFGLLFMVLTRYRQVQYLRFLRGLGSDTEEEASPSSDNTGVPQQFGLFYALGLAMVMEALFSAAYHVCPTDRNFQFDTTFMYIIAALAFIKIYQFRHGDAAASAYKVFLGVGLLLFVEVAGIYAADTAGYWVFTLLLYLLLSLVLTSILYSVGEWTAGVRLLRQVPRAAAAMARGRKSFTDYRNIRAVLPAVLAAVNLLLFVLGAVFRPAVSSYLLFIFIGNLLAYTVHYLSMKLYHGESVTAAAYAHLSVGGAAWAVALAFYNRPDSDFTLSPAVSRNLNRDCLVLDMYTNHDVWHMFSAAGLFFNFMFLLAIDDGVYMAPTDTLLIF